jgi:hypothetical protein
MADQPNNAPERHWPKLTPEQRDKAIEQFNLSLQDRHLAIMPAHDDMPPLRSRAVN